MLYKIYILLIFVFFLSACCTQDPAPIVYKDNHSYLNRTMIHSKQEEIYVDYNNNAIIDKQQHQKSKNDNEHNKNSLFMSTSLKSNVAPIKKEEDLQELKNPDTKDSIIIEAEREEDANSKFIMPMKNGYFHKQSEADRLVGRIYIMSNSDGEVLATANGKVVYVGDRKRGDKLKNYNNLLILEHEDNVMSIYANLDDIFIKTGSVVNVGDVIASVNKKHGRDYELDFSMRTNKKEIINPKDYLGR